VQDSLVHDWIIWLPSLIKCFKTNSALYILYLFSVIVFDKNFVFLTTFSNAKKRKFSRQMLKIKSIWYEIWNNLKKERIRTRYICLINSICPICMSITVLVIIMISRIFPRIFIIIGSLCIAESNSLIWSITVVLYLIIFNMFIGVQTKKLFKIKTICIIWAVIPNRGAAAHKVAVRKCKGCRQV